MKKKHLVSTIKETFLKKGRKMDSRLENLKNVVGDVDLEKGINYCAGEEDFYIDVLNDYVVENRKAEIEDLFSAENYSEYAVEVHALKSTSRTLGLEKMGNLAEKLEHAAKDGNIDYVKANHAEAMDYLAFLLKNIQELIIEA